ncbi:MAG: hypothetical protein ACM3XO_24675 [Bacteroidota bacterium]
MKKAVFPVILAFLLTACFPLTPPPAMNPILDRAGTAQASVQTAIIQTLTALPARTAVPPMSTATPVLASNTEAAPSATETLEPTIDVSADLATATAEMAGNVPTGTFEIAGASTGTFEAATSTELPATAVLGPATATLTPGVLTWGTLPPAVPYSSLTLINRAKTKAYISLQVTTALGGPAILEYPVRGKIEVEAPVGQYLYVAWVGGRKMVGEFRLRHDESLQLILYRDRIVIQ